MTQTSPGARDYALLVLLSALWGSSFLFMKLGVEEIPASSLTLGRLILAAFVLVIVARMAGQTLPRGLRVWGFITLAALTGNALPFTLIAWGEEHIDSGLAAILMAVMPLTTVILAHIFTQDEKMTLRKGVGVFLGIAGLVILIGPEKLSHLGEDTVRQLAVAGAAFCYGVNAVVTKHLIGLPRRALAAALMVVSTAIMLPVSLLLDQPWTLTLSPSSWAVLATLGILHTAVGTMIMLAILRRQGASFFAQLNFMVPLFGVLFGALILFERPPPNAYAALVVILLGVAVARGRGRKST